MIKLFLIEETADSVTYRYFINTDVPENTAIVKVDKKTLNHEMLKEDESGFRSKYSFAIRLVDEGNESGNYKKEAQFAWY